MSEATLSNTILATATSLYYPLVFIESLNGIKLQGKAKYGLVSRMVKGASDILVLIPNGGSLHIELKIEGNKQQPNQVEYQHRIEAMGHKYYVCYSYEDFFTIINSYLSDKFRQGLKEANKGKFEANMLDLQYDLCYTKL